MNGNRRHSMRRQILTGYRGDCPCCLRISRGAYGSCSGWAMLEVVVAVVLAGVLLGPIVGAALSAISQAANIREDNHDLNGNNAVATAWSYGPRAVSAGWIAGPELRVSVEDSEPVLAGVWIDGWFQGEWEMAPGDSLVLPVTIWTHAAGREALVRIRRPDAPWGPPWRSLVAGISGTVASVNGDVSSGSTEGRVIAHAPFAGNAPLVTSWGGEPTGASPEGLPLTFLLAPVGPVSLELCGQAQSWSMERGRDLDVYY